MEPRSAARVLVVVLVGLGAAGLAVSYASGGVKATVTDKGQDDNGRYVVVTTDTGGLEFQRYLPLHDWIHVEKGHHVVYHAHSGVTEIYTWEGGPLIWRG